MYIQLPLVTESGDNANVGNVFCTGGKSEYVLCQRCHST
jgi:hypothetical protein